MDVAGPMDRVEAGGGPRDQVGGVPGGQRTVVADQLLEIVTVDQPHRQVGDASALARGVDRDDVGVLDRGRRSHLLQEPGTHGEIVEELRRDHLQRDDPLELQVGGAVDDAHATAADDGLDPVPGDHRPGGKQTHRPILFDRYSLRKARYSAMNGIPT